MHDDPVGPTDGRHPHVELDGLALVAHEHRLDRPHPSLVDDAPQLAEITARLDRHTHRAQHRDETFGRGVPAVALGVPVPGPDAEIRGQPGQLVAIDAGGVGHVRPPTSASRSSLTPRIGMSAHVGRWPSS